MPSQRARRAQLAVVGCLILAGGGCGKPTVQVPQASAPAAQPAPPAVAESAATNPPRTQAHQKTPGQEPRGDHAAVSISEESGGGNAQTAEVAADLPDDESLTPDEYIRLGLPAHDREWGGADMARAAKILESFGQQKYRQLPRYQSKRSGEVFARLTSPANLELFRNDGLPLESRLGDALSFYQAHNQILMLYLAAFEKGDARATELVELLGSTLRMTVVMIELVDQLIPTLNKDDPSYPVRMQGLDRMRGGLATVVSRNLDSLSERSAYRVGELRRLIGYMQKTLPKIVPALPAASRAETLVRLKNLVDDPEMIDLRADLEELRSKIEASVVPKADSRAAPE